jgi:hypothetical protein
MSNSTLDKWKAEVVIDDIPTYVKKRYKNLNLPVQILWEAACGKMYTYDPDSGERVLNEETGQEIYSHIKPDSRLKAITQLMPYLYGRPTQDVRIETKSISATIDYSKLTDAQLKLAETKLNETLRMLGVPTDTVEAELS